MNLKQKKLFVELVKTGAPLKAYQKKLGLNKDTLQHHLGKLAEYEAELSPKRFSPESLAESLGATIVTKPAPEHFGSKKLKEKFDEVKEEATEPEKEEEDEEGETS
jgi:hypothetical protein